MRNVFLLVILFFYDLTCFGTPVEGNAKVVAAGSRPNIIFILTDDQRWDALGYAGNKLIHTPEMDKLAKSGAYFKNALVTTPICAGSRASILSGLYERTHGYNFQTGPVREEYMQQAYPKLLKEAGYYTGFFGKFGVRYAPKEELFDVYEDYDRNGAYKDRRGYYYKTLGEDTVHLTRYTGQKALDFIDQADLEKPFCLSLSFSAPHAHDPAEDQYFWQSATDQLYAGTEMPGPELGEDRFFNILPESVRNGFNRTRWYWRYDTPEKYQHSVKGYYRMIAGIDLEIANIRQRLKEKGLDKNTVIILMGDNGYFMGERQLAGKWLLYDNSIRVPLIIFDPRVKKHQDIEQMVLNIDVPATLLDMAGVDVPQSYHGKSLQPIVSGVTSNLQRDTVLIEHLWEFENIPPSEGVRTKDWKYFRYVNDKSIEELYNLRDDPKEINNLANDPAHQNVRAGLAAATDNLIQQYKDPLSAPPYGLMTDFIRKPGATTVNNSSPNYSWIVPQEAVMQQAYQVLVASSPQQLDKNIGDVWNSGQVRSSQSASIEQEKPLQPLTDYYWKVRIWDQDNRVSAYSDMQSFKTTGFQSGFTSGNIFRLENIKPVSVREIAEDSYFVDFGKDAFGTLAFTYEAPAPDTLTVRLGEKLEGNRIDQDPGGTIRYQEMKIAVSPAKKNYRVGLPPNERNTLPVAVALPDTFGVLMPFRYVELDGVKAELTSDDLTQKAYFYYWDEDESSFTSSDTTLNQIWDICKYSMKATSFSGIYVDGDRERIPYEADAYINQLGHYNTDREYSMGKQTIEWFMHHPTWPTEWLLHTALMMYQDYYYTGSTELIEKYYEPLKHKTLIHLAREDGLISSSSERVTDAYMAQLGFSDPSNRLRDIVDWPPAQKDTGWKLATEEGERDGHEMLPVNTVVNSFFYQNMKIMEELAHVLGRHEDEAQFSLMVAKTKKAINEKLFDKEKGIYIDGEGATHSSLHANMMPLAFGIVPESYQQSVVDFIKSRGMACSVYGAQFLLEGLYRVGESEYVLGLMTATHDRSWWNMIEMGSTITLEAWDMKYKPNADWNHAWGAAPANIIPRYLWGITPKTPGFGIISIQPQMGNLEHSTIKVPTLKGSVKGEYEYVNDRLKKYTIEIPANTVAEFSMQSAPNEVVHLNGQKVNPLFGSVRLEPGIHHIEIRVNSF